jgi:hypothetical protein
VRLPTEEPPGREDLMKVVRHGLRSLTVPVGRIVRRERARRRRTTMTTIA